jgi:hypothetical protein
MVAPYTPQPAGQADLFPEVGTKPNSKPARRSVRELALDGRNRTTKPGSRPDSTVLSRADLERELEQVLKLYRPHVARDQWSRVIEYQPIFVQRATASPQKVAKVFQRLQNLRFSLEKDEKVESHRARAEVIIGRLEELTAD